jgi:hypothetical protein
VSFLRYARRKDKSQDEIVAALRSAGWRVWIIGWPCDLLCFKRGRGLRTLECKTARGKAGTAPLRKDQQEQNAFCEITETPRVTSAMEALQAVGEVTL